MDLDEIIRDNPLLVAGASFWIPGLGQILCGRIKRGIMLLIPSFLVNLVRSLFILVETILRALGWQFGIPKIYWWNAANQVISILSTFVALIIRVWATYDAYRIAEMKKHLHWQTSTS